jgi:hypothetical protein
MVLVFTAFAALVGPLDGVSQHARFWPSFAVLTVLGMAAGFLLERNLRKSDSFWRQPVTAGVANALTNAVVVVWLGVVFFLLYSLLTKKGSIGLGMAVFAMCVAACYGGYRLGRRMQNRTLLPYGITFLVVVFWTFVLFFISKSWFAFDLTK